MAALLSPKGLSQDVVAEFLAENKGKWYEGDVRLTEGSQLHGMVRFDNNTNVVFFRHGTIRKSLNAKTCTSFTLNDPETHLRTFFSLEYGDEQTPSKFYFFELIKVFAGFSVLSRIDPVKVKQRTHKTGEFLTPNGKYYKTGAIHSSREFYQTETIYFLCREGEIKPYIRTVYKRTSEAAQGNTTSKGKFVNKRLMASSTGQHYMQLVQFARNNKLTFKRKQHLLRILEFYTGVLEQKKVTSP